MMVHLRGLNNWSANVRCVQIHFKYTYGLKNEVALFFIRITNLQNVTGK